MTSHHECHGEKQPWGVFWFLLIVWCLADFENIWISSGCVVFGWFWDVENLWIAVKFVFHHISLPPFQRASDCLIGLNVFPSSSSHFSSSPFSPMKFWQQSLWWGWCPNMSAHGIPHNRCYVDCLCTMQAGTTCGFSSEDDFSSKWVCWDLLWHQNNNSANFVSLQQKLFSISVGF